MPYMTFSIPLDAFLFQTIQKACFVKCYLKNTSYLEVT